MDELRVGARVRTINSDGSPITYGGMMDEMLGTVVEIDIGEPIPPSYGVTWDGHGRSVYHYSAQRLRVIGEEETQ